MKLSALLKKYNICGAFKIYDEKEFDTLALAQSEVEIPNCTFIDDVKYVDCISKYVTMVLADEETMPYLKSKDVGLCIVENPRNTYFKLHNALSDSHEYIRDASKTIVGKNCRISENASISKQNVIIGDNVIIEDFAVIYANTRIHDNCIIRSGVKLGSVDFEFKKDGDKIFGVEHYGGLILEKNVEIQCNSVVNRALYPWDDTVIGESTKIDANVMISHGVKIGMQNMIVAGAVIGGRTQVGDNCWIGLNATIKNGILIGNNARVNMGAVVTKDVAANESVTGNFAIEHSKFIENIKRSVK